MGHTVLLGAIGPAIGEWRRRREGEDGYGPRQADLAQAARLVGFGWSEPIVARIEAGTRALSLGEGMALATILTATTMADFFHTVRWFEVLGGPDAGYDVGVEVGDGLVIPAIAMPMAYPLVEGGPDGWHPDFVGREDDEIVRRAELPAEAVHRAIREKWGHTATAEFWRAGEPEPDEPDVDYDERWHVLLAAIAPAINAMYRALGIDREFDTTSPTDQED
jgi:hypothetical protein